MYFRARVPDARRRFANVHHSPIIYDVDSWRPRPRRGIVLPLMRVFVPGHDVGFHCIIPCFQDLDKLPATERTIASWAVLFALALDVQKLIGFHLRIRFPEATAASPRPDPGDGGGVSLKLRVSQALDIRTLRKVLCHLRDRPADFPPPHGPDIDRRGIIHAKASRPKVDKGVVLEVERPVLLEVFRRHLEKNVQMRMGLSVPPACNLECSSPPEDRALEGDPSRELFPSLHHPADVFPKLEPIAIFKGESEKYVTRRVCGFAVNIIRHGTPETSRKRFSSSPGAERTKTVTAEVGANNRPYVALRAV